MSTALPATITLAHEQPATGEYGVAIDHAGNDDLAIVRRAHVDPQAFAPLYERYVPVVYHYCLRRLAHPDAASDATSIIFTKAIAALKRFKPDPRREGASFRGWLFSIAHNVIIDLQRRNRNHLSLDAHADVLSRANHLTDPTASPEEQALRAEELSRVHVMLAHLPDRQRSIVELRLAGLRGAEIAHALGTTESAVKSAQFRAYETLRDLLRKSRITTEQQ